MADESAHPWEPPAVCLNIGWVAQLPAWPRPHNHLLNRGAQILEEGLSEGVHEVGVALQGRAPRQHPRRLIRKDGDVLPVAGPQPRVTRPVCEEDVRVLLPSLRRTPARPLTSRVHA